MITKKGYVLIADILINSIKALDNLYDSKQRIDGIWHVIGQFQLQLKKDNPRFDTQRFQDYITDRL